MGSQQTRQSNEATIIAAQSAAETAAGNAADSESNAASSAAGAASRVDSISASIFDTTEEDIFELPDETTTSQFINSSGVISSGSASYTVKRYEIEAGKKYRVSGTSSVTTNANFTLVGFKESADVSGTVDIVLPITYGTPDGTAIDYAYEPTVSGNIFVTNWQSLALTVYEITDVINSKLATYETQIAEINEVVSIKSFNKLLSKPANNPLKYIGFGAGFASIFLDWGFIGDSLTSGQHEYKVAGVTNYISLYDYSWGQFLCRLCDTDGYNFSWGGSTAKGWLTTHGDAERRLTGAELNPKKAYILSMATNDRNNYNNSVAGSYPAGDVSTDVDVADYNNNADTYAGYMAEIIQRLAVIQPKAKIFILTLPKPDVIDSSNVELWNEVVRDLADLFTNVYLIDVYTYGVVQDSTFAAIYKNGGHYNTLGYQYYAYMIANYIDWIVQNNLSDFEEEAFVGTSYSYN